MDYGLTERTALQLAIKPLTRRNLQGVVYERLDPVNVQIQNALRLTPESLIERTRLREIESPLYLQEEALVYLIREYHLENRRSLVDSLTEELLRRCTNRISNLVRESVETRYTKDCFRHIVAEVFERVLDLESDRGDFAQVRFWLFLNRQIVEGIKQYLKEQNRDALTESLDWDEDADSDGPSAIEVADEKNFPIDDRAAYREGLSVLNEPYRTAFVLRHYENWQIESEDPNEPTISRHFGRSSRTIRHWLMKASEELRNWRGDKS